MLDLPGKQREETAPAGLRPDAADTPASLMSGQVSPYLRFSAQDWAALRSDTPMTLTADEVARLRSLGDPVDPAEVARIHLPLSRLVHAHFETARHLFAQRQRFLGTDEAVKTPFIIGIAGPVAVGKSTTARVLKELLARWPTAPRVDLVTTDGFLWPNAALLERGLMERKGFPESYDIAALLAFLSRIKSGERRVPAPLYSHLVYDVLAGEQAIVDQPDILILEGINVLQVRELAADGRTIPFVSDYFDFSIYVDAEEELIRDWYLTRFMRLRETAFHDPRSFFHRYAKMPASAAQAHGEHLWTTINLKNLVENIRPTRPRADLILHKGANHLAERVYLRRL